MLIIEEAVTVKPAIIFFLNTKALPVHTTANIPPLY